MSTSISDLERLLNTSRESENLEFKEAKNQFDLIKLFRYCVAIANEGGGKLLLGVSDSIPHQIVGSNAFQSTEDVASKIFVKLHFRVDVEEITHPSGRVVIFHIPSRPKGTAYQFEGAYWMRSTEDTVPMTEDHLRKIFEEGKPDLLLQSAKENCTADDTIRLLDTQSYFDLLKLAYPTSRDGVLERFEQEKLIQNNNGAWTITNLGAILFAKKMDEFDGMTRKAPRVIVYDGIGKIKTRLDRFVLKGYASGFENLIELINGQIPTNEVIKDALRQEIKMFPEIAVRELVANALIHQDFNEAGSSVVIEIYTDRMEITNPGKPFIPTERFIDEYQSRNEKLADIMRRLGICEEKGSGVDKVINATEILQLPAPDFRVSDRRTIVVLFGHKDLDDMDRNDRIRACYQHACLRYVMNQRMTNQTLRERFKLPEEKSATVSQIIADAVEANLIKLDDTATTSRRYARYLPFWA